MFSILLYENSYKLIYSRYGELICGISRVENKGFREAGTPLSIKNQVFGESEPAAYGCCCAGQSS